MSATLIGCIDTKKLQPWTEGRSAPQREDCNLVQAVKNDGGGVQYRTVTLSNKRLFPPDMMLIQAGLQAMSLACITLCRLSEMHVCMRSRESTTKNKCIKSVQLLHAEQILYTRTFPPIVLISSLSVYMFSVAVIGQPVTNSQLRT